MKEGEGERGGDLFAESRSTGCGIVFYSSSV